ncbi:MAG TPA: hypothetical protein VIV40_03890 [Kofleriaceae bacterium]
MMTRLQFLRSLGQLALAGVALPALAGCKDDDPAPTPDAGGNQQTPDARPIAMPDAASPDAPMMPTTCASTSAAIGSNHGHVIMVTAAEANAGIEKTYQIQGTATHPHSVLITAADFAALRANHTLTVTSSNDAGHTHPVTVMCIA